MPYRRLLVLIAVCALSLDAADDGYEDDGRPRLGIGMTPTSTQAQAATGLGVEQGVEVAVVFPGTVAAQMGMRPGDVVLAVDGQAVNSMVELRDAVVARLPGDPVRVAVARGGERLELGAPLSTWPDGEPYPHIDPAWERRLKDQQRRRLASESRDAAKLRQELADLKRALAARAEAGDRARDPALAEAAAALAALPAWTLSARWRFDLDDVTAAPATRPAQPLARRGDRGAWRLDYDLTSR